MRIQISLAIAASVWMTASAAAMDLSKYTIDGGGGTCQGNGFVLSGTIGQPDAGYSAGGDFFLSGGFWVGGPVPCPGDTNGDGVVDLTDLSRVLSDFGLIGAGLGGDVNGDNVVDLTDLGIVLANFGVAC